MPLFRCAFFIATIASYLALDRLIDLAEFPYQLVKHAALGEPCLGAHAVFP